MSEHEMKTTQLFAETGRLDELLELTRDAQALAARPRERRKLHAELAMVQGRLERMRQRMLAAVLVEVLWQYVDCARGTYAGDLAGKLVAEILARTAQ
jgi:hypothetical protein